LPQWALKDKENFGEKLWLNAKGIAQMGTERKGKYWLLKITACHIGTEEQ
jgi:hypothetical protein